jgi:hypothetical protein
LDQNANSKDRRRKMPGASKKMDQGTEAGAAGASDEGLTPSLQAHIGRHVRAMFDEVAREPIPEHLLRLLKDLEKTGEK